MRMHLFSLLCGLTAAVPGVAAADMGEANARARSGSFDMQGDVRCAQEVGETLAPCAAAVARAGAAAVVVVTFPNGFKRTLMFSGGAFMRGNATMSGVGTDMEWRLSDGSYAIRVDDQRFAIPATLVLGE